MSSFTSDHLALWYLKLVKLFWEISEIDGLGVWGTKAWVPVLPLWG